MKQLISYQGRSLLFNTFFVLLNLIGLTLIVLGYHKNFEGQSFSLKVFGFLLIGLTTGFLFVFKGRLLMSAVSRVLVGGICIVSGLVKANDPIGFSYKLEEYFEDGALAYRIKEMFGMPSFSLEFLIDYALFFSVFICVFEIVLGVLLIIGGQIKKVVYLTLSMMIFFLFLTWHTAECDPDKTFVDRDTYSMSDPIALMKIEASKVNKDIKIIKKTAETLLVDEIKRPQCVDDCGCFGDAMKGSVGRSLTPSESMWKDIILVYLTLWIFIAQWIIKPNSRKENLYFGLSALVIVMFFSWVFGWSFPILFGIIVVLAGLWILRAGGKFLGNYLGSALIVSVISILFITYVLLYLPIKDYRPYAVGSDLVAKMNDGEEGIYESLLVYKNKSTGVEKSFSASSQEYVDSKIWELDDWKYISMEQKVIKETKLPSISDFEPSIPLDQITEIEYKLLKDELEALNKRYVQLESIQDQSQLSVFIDDFNRDDYPEEHFSIKDTILKPDETISDLKLKDFILNADQIAFISVKNLNQGNWSNIEQFKVLSNLFENQNVPLVMICNAGKKDIEIFRSKYDLNIPVFINDEITIKAISRSNPSLLVLKKGTVAAKYPHRGLPNIKTLKQILK